MDRVSAATLLAELDRLRSLLKETIDQPETAAGAASVPATASAGAGNGTTDSNSNSSPCPSSGSRKPPNNRKLLKRVVSACKNAEQNFSSLLVNAGGDATSSGSSNNQSDADEEEEVEETVAVPDANYSDSDESMPIVAAKKSVAFKLRPLTELLDPVHTMTYVARQKGASQPAAANKIASPAPAKGKRSSILKPSAPICAAEATEKQLQIAVRRLPADLSSLLRAEGLREVACIAQTTTAAISVSKATAAGPKSKTTIDKSATTNTTTTKTMPRKRAAPQKIRVAAAPEATESDEADADDDQKPIVTNMPRKRGAPQKIRVAAAPEATESDEADADDDQKPIATTLQTAAAAEADDNRSSADEEQETAAATAAVDSPDEAEDAEAEEAEEVASAPDSPPPAAASTDSDEDFVVGKRKRKAPAVASKSKVKSEPESGASDSAAGKKKRKRRRIKKNSDDDGDDESAKSGGGDGSGSDDLDDSKTKAGRKNIRKVIKARDLESETKRAAREEVERKKRIEERQRLYNTYYDAEDGEESGKPETVKVLDKLILDFDEKTKEELISVDTKLVRKLKPHQGNGVKFMWDTCFESIERINRGPGSGCILAHCMGLGKSLQVVTLVHTLLSHSQQTGVEKVLVICPLSTVLNWVNEFKIWLKQCAANKDIEIYEISKFKQNYERVYHINEWHQEGGVLIMGYDMFRNISSETSRLKKRDKEKVQAALIKPGADLVVCDEGHLLKNSKTSLSKAVNRVNTLRRVVLTGTPLQNNLNEYYCMVQFVKPNLLGKYNEYLNRFVNPITNGQYVDSTPYDIQMMKRRSHILHKLLDGCVQRCDYAVLAPYLPVKHEYVVYVQLTPMQIALYRYYMEHKPSGADTKTTRSSVLFQDFQNLQRIWTHPRVLRYNSDRFEIAAQKKRDAMSDEDSDGSLKDFIDDTDDTDESEAKSTPPGSDVESIPDSDDSGKKGKRRRPSHNAAQPSTSRAASAAAASSSTGRLGTRRTRAAAAENHFEEPDQPAAAAEKPENPTEWWMSMCPEEELDVLSHSGKLMLIFSLLEECEQIGDKLLVFSQSLYSLDVIENFLARIDDCTQRCAVLAKRRKAMRDSDDDEEDAAEESLDPEAEAERKRLGGFSGSWSAGLDYFRLDGSTNIENRNLACKAFNREDNPRARLFLISTRAGGLGINLVAANRVVIFDVSWNPSHDIQSIFRVYRFGQKKPCYIYRFIAMGTMEEKVYERQVTKLAISKRVIDEHQIDRHYKENDLMELYKTDLEPAEERPTPILPKDRLFAGQLQKFANIIYKYHEHESLLENKQEETLNKEELEAAWAEFEAEKTARPVINYMPQQRAPGSGPLTSNNIFGIRSDVMLQLLRITARKAYPATDENHIKQLVPLLLQQLYEKMSTGDTSMLQQLMVLQTELEAPPNFAFNQMVNQMHNPSVALQQQLQSQLQQQQILQQQQQQQLQNRQMQQQPLLMNAFNQMMAQPNALGQINQQINQQPQQLPQQLTPEQQLIVQAQNRLLKAEARQKLASRPPPTQTSAVIELD